MILDILSNRCSVRMFREQTIPQDVIDYILEAGRLSPSGGNEQPWAFGLVTERRLIEAISCAAYNQKWIGRAPLLIVLCTRVVEDERGARDIQVSRFPEWKEEILNADKGFYSRMNAEEHQTKIPGTHMVLAALEHGIGSTWVSYFNVGEVSKLLGLPPEYIPSEILVFGYPGGEMRPRPKKNREEVVFVNKFNK
ncbi:MAG: nitroreductase family protein [Bacillota bacterium]|nr:nitroreductase family protein [Bacillota bacterium]